MILAGVDEAGLGPALGPLAVAAVALRVPGAWTPAAPWNRLRAVVTRETGRGETRLLVADSKVVHRARGVAGLERTAFAFLGAGLPEADWPDGRESLLDRLGDGETPASLTALPWYAGRAWRLEFPAEETAALRACCERVGVRVAALRARLVTAERLNARFGDGTNKAEALLAETGAHLRWLDAAFPDEELAALVDRQGGRTQYVPFLTRLFPGRWIETLREGPEGSVYEIRRGGAPLRIAFRVRADGAGFCTALASIWAKTLRERCMADLNAWFAERRPGLRPTAGYHGDARRFLDDVADLLAAERIDPRFLVRSR